MKRFAFSDSEAEKPPAPLPDESLAAGASAADLGGVAAGAGVGEEQTLNIIREDSAEAVTLPRFPAAASPPGPPGPAAPESVSSRRSSGITPDTAPRPDTLNTRECLNNYLDSVFLARPDIFFLKVTIWALELQLKSHVPPFAHHKEEP